MGAIVATARSFWCVAWAITWSLTPTCDPSLPDNSAGSLSQPIVVCLPYPLQPPHLSLILEPRVFAVLKTLSISATPSRAAL